MGGMTGEGPLPLQETLHRPHHAVKAHGQAGKLIPAQGDGNGLGKAFLRKGFCRPGQVPEGAEEALQEEKSYPQGQAQGQGQGQEAGGEGIPQAWGRQSHPRAYPWGKAQAARIQPPPSGKGPP